VVAVVSGPEPQRTAFENKVREQLATINGPHLIISGKPGKRCEERTGPIRVLPHLSAKDLRDALWNAELIVGRTGYTTLMDLHALGRSALLVPTPGQLEQEYLGTLHAGLGGHVVQRQDAMEIAPVLSDPPRGAAMARASTALADALADLSCLIGAHRPSTFTR
jgi:UDP-N-acetylglucosamine:LPS N-acetylglucosamine transferase